MPKSNNRRKTLSAEDVDNLLCELSNINIASTEKILVDENKPIPNVVDNIEAIPSDTKRVTSPIKAVKLSQPSVDEPAPSVAVVATVAPESSPEKKMIRLYCKV